MADPFSTAVGTVSLIEVCWRVGSYLRNMNASRGEIEQELKGFKKEVDAIRTVNDTVLALWNAQSKQTEGDSRSNDAQITKVWNDVATVLKSCQSRMKTLEACVKDIAGKDGTEVTGTRDGVKKEL